MNHFPFTHNFSHYSISTLFSGKNFLLEIILTILLLSSILMTQVQANDSKIKIVDVWVEDGFLIHVVFEAHPNNSSCVFNGEGLIEFEVVYTAQTSSGRKSVFGVAIWYPGSNPDDWIKTGGETMLPQAICTDWSPCQIHEVNIVNTWCPDTDGPFFQE